MGSTGLAGAVMAGEAALERGPNHGLVCLEPRHLVELLGAARLELQASEAGQAGALLGLVEPPALAQETRADVAATVETRAPENVAPAGAGTVGLQRVWVTWRGDGVSVDLRGDVVDRAHVSLPVPGTDGAVVELNGAAVMDALRQHAYRFCAEWLVEWGVPEAHQHATVTARLSRPEVAAPLWTSPPMVQAPEPQPPAPGGPRHCWFCQSAPCQCPPVHDDDLLPSAQRVPLAQDWPGRRIERVPPSRTDALNDAPHVAVLAAALLGTEGRVDVPPDDDECVSRAVRMWVQIVRELRAEGAGL